jgi:hypothetical protein
LHRRLDLAHQRIRQLTADNQQLREQLARAHGALRTATINTPRSSKAGPDGVSIAAP